MEQAHDRFGHCEARVPTAWSGCCRAVLFRKRITRVKLLGFLAAQAPCVVAMEACAGAHY
jgi:hypothetical protein